MRVKNIDRKYFIPILFQPTELIDDILKVKRARPGLKFIKKIFFLHEAVGTISIRKQTAQTGKQRPEAGTANNKKPAGAGSSG